MSDYPDIFDRCIGVVLRNEGGYVNHPSDPGGETNMGITKRTYPDLDIRTLTRDQAIMIYYNDYWLPMNLDRIVNDELVLHVFDMGVNAGIRTSIKILQRLIGAGVDGYIGGKTRKAINDYKGNVVDEFIKRRKLYYVTLIQHKPELRVFIKGWLARIEKTKFNGTED